MFLTPPAQRPSQPFVVIIPSVQSDDQVGCKSILNRQRAAYAALDLNLRNGSGGNVSESLHRVVTWGKLCEKAGFAAFMEPTKKWNWSLSS